MSRVGQRGSVMSCRGRETRAAANFFFRGCVSPNRPRPRRVQREQGGLHVRGAGQGSGRNCWEGARDTSLFANGGARFIAAARGDNC
jgi:hypothetical protein